MNNNMFAKAAIWMVIALVLFTVFKQFESRQKPSENVSYTQFMDQAKAGQIKRVDVQGRNLNVTPVEGNRYTLTSPGDLWMVDDLRKAGVQVYGKPEEEQSLLTTIFVSWFPMLLLIGVWIFFMRQMQGGGRGGAFSFGKSRARMLDETNNAITFADVAGCDEAKEEVHELVEFLRDPSKFQKLGGRIPRGVLMVGSPGTGKTLLAKAIAGEAKVPFFSISGSDFVEMFVGVGAARVRDMFDQAKKHAPCIIFIDEIDAVGRQRGAGLGGGNDEREQTLNQMLVEMDGFETGMGVIVIAATNRPDVLDPALLRPGRFDRQVVVPLPDIRGREQILNVHMRKVPIGADVRADLLARGSPGFSGADLANLVNEAALFAARRSARVVEMVDFEKAKDKIMMGAERKSMVMTEEERLNTAYHESGHTLVAKLMPKSDPGAQGHDHSARPRAGRDDAVARAGSLRVRPAVPAEPDRGAVWRADRRRSLHESDDDRRQQRLRARDANGARHGDALRHERCAGPDGLRRKRRRNLPGTLDHQDDQRVGRNDAQGRCRNPSHHRRAVRDRAQAHRRKSRQDRSNGQSAARMGNDRYRTDRRHPCWASPTPAEVDRVGAAGRRTVRQRRN